MELGSVGTIIGAILILLPGATLRVTARRVRSEPTTSAFEETLYTVLGGLLLSAVTIALLGALRSWFPGAYPNPRELFGHPGDYFVANYGMVARTLAQYVLLSNLLAWLVGAYSGHLSALSRRLPIPPRTASRQDIWSTYMIDLVPKRSSVRAAIGTDFGLVITGTVAGFEVIEGLPNVVLTQPIYIQAPGADPERLDDRWPYLLVAGQTAQSVALSYVAD